MHHLSQQDLDEKLRRPHVKRYKTELASGLLNPALSEGHRRLLERRMALAGKPRVYRASDSSPPGGRPTGPLPKDPPKPEVYDFMFTLEGLSPVPRSKLMRFAHQLQLGVRPASTKAQVVQAILKNHKETNG